MIKVYKEGQKVLSELTDSQMKRICEDLTIENPAYIQAKKYSRYGYTTLPPYLFYYSKIDGRLVVPRGYTIPFEYETIRDDRIEKRVLYPKFKLELRKRQQEAFEAWSNDRDNGLIVMPTGSGKSILGCYLMAKTKQKALVIVQKDDLIHGWMQDIEVSLGIKKDKIGIIKAKKKKVGRNITLCTIQTLSKLPLDELLTLYSSFGMVITDECHHIGAKSYNILKHFKAKYLVGLTATDDRNDGLRDVIDWLMGGVCYRSKELGDKDEDILPYSVIIRNSSICYQPDPVFKKTKYGFKKMPLDIHARNKVIIEDENFNDLVTRDIYKEYRAGKPSIVFIHEKNHIRSMRDRLLKMGVPKSRIQLFYGDSKESDAAIKERAESKEVLITIATYAKATEGTNVKSWEVAFLVTSVNNEKNVIQAVGRIRRRKEGKKEAIVYDYRHPLVAGMKNHGITRDRAYKKTCGKIISGKDRSTSIVRGFRK